jgi:predicted kinase
MNTKPTCIIVTGRPGSGKTTLAQKLGEHLRLPVVSRDEIKEGYVVTSGLTHEQLPPDINGVVTDHFFRIVNQYLAGNVSIVIEAAFQHKVWASRLNPVLEVAHLRMVLCELDAETALARRAARRLADPERERFHPEPAGGTGDYDPPRLEVPTLQVDTSGGYRPAFEDIVEFARG